MALQNKHIHTLSVSPKVYHHIHRDQIHSFICTQVEVKDFLIQLNLKIQTQTTLSLQINKGFFNFLSDWVDLNRGADICLFDKPKVMTLQELADLQQPGVIHSAGACDIASSGHPVVDIDLKVAPQRNIGTFTGRAETWPSSRPDADLELFLTKSS